MELSIDTSTEIAGVAVSDEGVPLAELNWSVGTNHTTQLLPAIDRLLDLSHLKLAATSAVFVSLGPGSFSGIRVALSTAKGLAFSLGVPLLGVGALEVEAFPFAWSSLPICAMHDAGRSELAVATYQQWKGHWRCVSAERLVMLEGLCSETTEKTVFCGEIPRGVQAGLRQALGELAVIPDQSARLRRAGNLAPLAWQKLQSGQVDDPATLQPIYLRRPHITIPKHEH